MNIYEIEFLSDAYQSCVAEDINIWKSDSLAFSGEPKLSNWVKPSFRIYQPHLKRGDFFGVGPGTLGIWKNTLDNIGPFFERSGELLEVDVAGELAFCVNITECVNCLDLRESEVVLGRDSGAIIRVKRFSFVESLVPESSLFKIPETAKSKILCVSRDGDGFKEEVEKIGLQSIRFRSIYSTK